MKRLIQHIFIILILLQGGCEQGTFMEGCFKSAGKNTAELRILDAYDSVYIDDVFDLCLVNDTNHQVIIETGENMLPFIKTTVKNNTLYLENTSHCRWMRGYKHPVLYLSANNLREIYINTACKVYSNDTIEGYRLRLWALSKLCEIDLLLNYDQVRVKSSHATVADIRLSGITRFLVLWAYHGCRIDATGLKTKSTLAKNHGIGDFKINASMRIEAHLFNSGNIYYTGNPEQIEIATKESSGDLIELDE